MGHDHSHVDLRAGARNASRLWWAFALIALFLVVQVAVGLGMALAAITAANRATQAQHRTFGLYRLEILAALSNAVLPFADCQEMTW